MECLAPFSELAAFVLSEDTRAPANSRVNGSPFHVAIEGLHFKRRLLLLGGDECHGSPTSRPSRWSGQSRWKEQ